jgi:ERCC4-type nuclease
MSETNKLIVKIDVRERDLFAYFKSTLEKHSMTNEILLLSENLPLGDIIIGDHLGEKIIIERKTLSDLAASIKDGRYTEQSYRLNGIEHHNHNIIYLIEGDITKYNIFKAKMDKMTLYSAMFSINYYKGFSVMRSNSMEETSLILCNMVSKMLKSDKPAYYSNKPVKNMNDRLPPIVTSEPSTEKEASTVKDVSTEDTEDPVTSSKDYCGVIKKIKKDNVTQENIGEIMLCQIPSISSVTAIAILTKFATISNLIIELKKDPICLNEVSYITSSGQKRKISKTCIENVKKYLLM